MNHLSGESSYCGPGILLDRVPQNLVSKSLNEFQRQGFRVIGISTRGPISTIFDSEALAHHEDTAVSYGEIPEQQVFDLSREELSYYEGFQGLFILTLSRFCTSPDAWTPNAMSTHYFLLANWAERYLQATHPDAIFGYSMPHDPSSFILYLASKRRKIPYIFLDATVVANQGRYLSCSYTNRLLLARGSATGGNQELALLLNRVTLGLRRNYAAFRTRHVDDMAFLGQVQGDSRSTGYSSWLARTLEPLGRTVNALSPTQFLRSNIDRRFPYLKVRRGLWSALRSRPNAIDIVRLRITQWLRIRRLRSSWSRLARNSSYNASDRNFVLLPLPSQPEAQTLPGALHNHDVALLIRRIIPVLPANLDILIKIHPVQFSMKNIWTTMIDWWDPDFFKNLAQLAPDRIHFAPLESDPEYLLDASVGMVVVNGSMGYESLARGKRVIHTAPVWYESAEGAMKCAETADFAVAFDQMLGGAELSQPVIHFAKSTSFITHGESGEIGPADVPTLVCAFRTALERFHTLPDTKWRV